MQSDERNLFSVAQIQHLMRVEFNRARRYHYPLVCLLIEIDRLGHLRDLHGYEAKETIVQGVVELLMDVTRASDFLGRTADDRLMAVVPHTSPEGGRQLAERLLAGASQCTFDIGGDLGDKTIGISLSIGLSHNQQGETMYFDALFESAQQALAEAGAQGGARYVERAPGLS